MTTTDQQPDGPDRTRIRLGLAIMLVGLVFMAYRLDLWEVDLSRHFWPFVPLAIGLVQLIAPPMHKGRRRSRRGGTWLIYIGVWGLISEFNLFGLDYDTSWPLLIIAFGLNMVWRSFESPRPRNAQEN
jgi:hypothetical protein